jgi:hypothetical protein
LLEIGGFAKALSQKRRLENVFGFQSLFKNRNRIGRLTIIPAAVRIPSTVNILLGSRG